MSHINSDLIKAFPAALRDDALKVIAALPEASLAAQSFSVEINEDTVWIPYRIYHDPAEIDFGSLTQNQLELLACLMTRHHNGFVREEYSSSILACNHEWVPPFVVQLVGEYVLEIICSIRESVNRLDPELYRQFLIRNPSFYATTKRRVQSYWNCYHREKRREDYSGFQLLEYFDRLISAT